MKRNLADALVRGSEEINRLQHEIKLVTGTLMSNFDLNKLEKDKPVRVFSKTRTAPRGIVFYWKIGRGNNIAVIQAFCVSDVKDSAFGQSAQSVLTGGKDNRKIEEVEQLIFSNLGSGELALDNTIVIHDELETLVEWALEFFGERFRLELSPLFYAAGASWAVKGK